MVLLETKSCLDKMSLVCA
jgi:hypothetical protein